MVEMAQALNLEKAPLIKSLLFEEKKKGVLCLLLAHNDTKIEKQMWKQLNVTPGNVRMPSNNVLKGLLK